MADISTWSPLDESNTAAPPAGAPENMPTNTVNNTLRAMMGATRRWYDQLANGTASIGYLSLSGGVLNGPVSSYSSITCNGALQAGGKITGLGDIEAANNITGGIITANVAINAAALNSSGALFVAGGASINGNTAVGGDFVVGGAGGFNHDLAVTGTVFAHAFADTDGVVRVLDVLRDLEARVAALEGAP